MIQRALKAGEQPPRGNPFVPEEEKPAAADPMEEAKEPAPSMAPEY